MQIFKLHNICNPYPKYFFGKFSKKSSQQKKTNYVFFLQFFFILHKMKIRFCIILRMWFFLIITFTWPKSKNWYESFTYPLFNYINLHKNQDIQGRYTAWYHLSWCSVHNWFSESILNLEFNSNFSALTPFFIGRTHFCTTNVGNFSVRKLIPTL